MLIKRVKDTVRVNAEEKEDEEEEEKRNRPEAERAAAFPTQPVP
jgi:hypothetical protein